MDWPWLLSFWLAFGIGWGLRAISARTQASELNAIIESLSDQLQRDAPP